MTREEIIAILNKELWSISETAKFLGTTKQNLLKLKREKALVPIKSEHAGPFYLRKDIIAYMNNYCCQKQKRTTTKKKYQNLLRLTEKDEED